MEPKLSLAQSEVPIIYPNNPKSWMKVASQCIAIANSGGGILRLQLPSDANPTSLFSRFTKKISQLTTALEYTAIEDCQSLIDHIPSHTREFKVAKVSKNAQELILKIYPTLATLTSTIDANNHYAPSPDVAVDSCKQGLFDLLAGIQFSPQPYLMLDSKGAIISLNIASKNLLGIHQDPPYDLTFHDFLLDQSAENSFEKISAYISNRQVWQGTLQLQDTIQQTIPVEISMTPIWHGESTPNRLFVQLKDRRNEIANEQQLKRLAFYDPTTGLANRALLKDRLSMALASQRRQRLYGALLFIDLDHFKQINDVHGHSEGDAVLKKCATRLLKNLRQDDTLARIGGDEFVALLLGFGASFFAAQIQAKAIAEKLLASLDKPLVVNGHQYYIQASIGITLFPKALETAEDLLREADTAMYGAKAAGRNTVLVFESSMYQAVRKRFRIERELREAIRQKQFELYFQPQVDDHHQISSWEVLIRWNHPQQGVVSPMEFISIAEETGQIIPIGDWVLDKTCEILGQCERAGKPVALSANISARQFKDTQFVGNLKKHIRHHQIDANNLTLEMTESLLIEDATATAETMHELAKLGINFSIDDFGTGYSNLKYLRQLPLKELKIDKSFIQNICENNNDAAVVKTMLSLAAHLNLYVVAEGVEEKRQSQFLNKLAKIKMQGYLFGKPIPTSIFLNQWLQNYNKLRDVP
ncbi:EAL domain-containing protein [Aliikangiella maris]|uniref:EAL domain-containing protein n=2 Tax=Aliikangiella maris TaxID=3162458 RepID=A0ABV3MSI7_9GAMM